MSAIRALITALVLILGGSVLVGCQPDPCPKGQHQEITGSYQKWVDNPPPRHPVTVQIKACKPDK